MSQVTRSIAIPHLKVVALEDTVFLKPGPKSFAPPQGWNELKSYKIIEAGTDIAPGITDPRENERPWALKLFREVKAGSTLILIPHGIGHDEFWVDAVL